MGKIIYNTDDELVFSLQGEKGELLEPEMKDSQFNFSGGGQPDITVGYFDFSLRFTIDINEEDYLDFLKFQGLTLIGEEGSIVITSFGRDFLKFLIDSGRSDLRPN